MKPLDLTFWQETFLLGVLVIAWLWGFRVGHRTRSPVFYRVNFRNESGGTSFNHPRDPLEAIPAGRPSQSGGTS